MKDQLRLLRECLRNEIPAIVFQGDDSCAVEVLEAAVDIYKKHGATKEFLYDFELLIDDFKLYQKKIHLMLRWPICPQTRQNLFAKICKRKVYPYERYKADNVLRRPEQRAYITVC